MSRVVAAAKMKNYFLSRADAIHQSVRGQVGVNRHNMIQKCNTDAQEPMNNTGDLSRDLCVL